LNEIAPLLAKNGLLGACAEISLRHLMVMVMVMVHGQLGGD